MRRGADDPSVWRRRPPQPTELLDTAVSKLEGETPSGLPKMWVADVTDIGNFCGPACAAKGAREAHMRPLGEHERILSEQFDSESDRSLMQGEQYQTESLNDDTLFWETRGNTRNIVSTRPLPGYAGDRYDAGDITEMAQRLCSGENCTNPLWPGGTGEETIFNKVYRDRRPWTN